MSRPNTVRLNTVYVSQDGADADLTFFDCGPACVLSIVKTVTHHPELTVDDIVPQVVGGPHTINQDRGTSLAQLRALAGIYQVKFTNYSSGSAAADQAAIAKAREALENAIADQRPVIVLLNYERLPQKNKGFPNFVGGHIVVVHGYDMNSYYYDDPFFPFSAAQKKGENQQIAKDALFFAMAPLTGTTNRPFGISFQMNILSSHRATLVAGDTPKSTPVPRDPRGMIVSGTVTHAGKAVARAVVRLRGAFPRLALLPNAVTALAPGDGVWDHFVTGYDGDVVTAYHTGWVDPSISYFAFMRGIAQYNPHLVADGYQMHADQIYQFPRPAQALLWSKLRRGDALLAAVPSAQDASDLTRWHAVWQAEVAGNHLDLDAATFIDQFRAINHLKADQALDAKAYYRLPEVVTGRWVTTWTRSATGIEGSIDEVYNLSIAPEFTQLSRSEFRAAVLAHNPVLHADTGHFYRSKRYTMPETHSEMAGYLATVTNEKGEYRLPFDLRGDYTLEVSAEGFQPATVEVTLQASQTVDVVLTPTPVKDRPRGINDVWVQRENNHFVLQNSKGGKTAFRFVGANVVGLAYWGVDFPNGGGVRFPGDAKAVSHQITVLHDQMQGRVLRVFLARDSYNDSASSDRAVMWERLRQLLAVLPNDMYVIVAFTDVHNDRGFVLSSDKASEAYKFKPEGSGSEMLRAEWYQTGYMASYKAFVEATVRHFATDSAAKAVAHRIMAWEIGNEVRCIPGLVTFLEARTRTKAFFKAMASVIRQTEKKANPDGPFHLISTGAINSQNIMPGADIFEIQTFYQTTPELGFLTAHAYADRGAEEAKRGRAELDIANALNMPFVMEEFSYDRLKEARAPRIERAVKEWFGSGADGALYWGFLAGADNNDGGDHDGILQQHEDFTDVLEALKKAVNA